MGLFDELGSLFNGATSVTPNSGVAPTAAPAAPAMTPLGFVGGLMGASPNSPGMNFAGDALGALGRSMMTSPSNNLLRDFGSSYQAQTKASTADAQKQAMIAKLRAQGLNDDQIMQALQQSGMLSPLDMLGQATGLTSFAPSAPRTAQPGASTPSPSNLGTPEQIAANKSFI